MAYGMLIDQKKCIGCHACSVACKEAHGTPPAVTRSHVIREIEGTYPNVRRNIIPTLCMHCENAPCVAACAAEGATYKRDDGIVVIDKEKCIGCKACIAACPYGARYYCESEQGYFGELNEYESAMYPAYMPHGTVDKCTFCSERIDGDGSVQACVAACPAGARYFGDLEEIKAKAEAEGGYQLLAEEGTNPSVWYIPCTVTEPGSAEKPVQ